MIIVATSEGIEIDGILLTNTVEMQAYISAHRPQDLEVGLKPIPPKDLMVEVGVHAPKELSVYLSVIQLIFYEDLQARISAHIPHDLDISMNIMQKHELLTRVGAHPPKDLIVFFRLFHSVVTDLIVMIKPVHRDYTDLYVGFWGWALKDFMAPIGAHLPHDLYGTIHAWHVHPVNALIGSITPQDLSTTFVATPEDGYDLIVVHRTFRTSPLLVEFNIWKGVATLPIWLYGIYYQDFSVYFTMGGKHDFSILLPMTTGYRDLFVTLKPASRVMTTIIPILTMEIHDLYVSINQGWPCGFGSSYKNFSVELTPAFFLAFTAVFKVIDGSGVRSLGVYVNRSNFNSFFNSYDIRFELPETTGAIDTNILDQVAVRYENQFDDIVEDIIQLRFSWPRIRIFSGELNLSVVVYPYKQDPYHDLSIQLYAARAEVPKMPTSQPLVQRTRPWEEPVWPAVFQVKEVELWADDPPEITRVIEVVFGEQVHEYYWLSNEQRAYKKEDYETWTLMTRGYLPHAQYSGQIDYVSLYEISDMEKYETIDAAFRALIRSFHSNGQSKLEVLLNVTGSYHSFSAIMDVWGTDRLYNLAVFIEPMHPHDLTVEITCVS
jgi:hypothetical protein